MTKLEKALSDKGTLIIEAINSNRLVRWFNPDTINNDDYIVEPLFVDLYKHKNSSDNVTEIDRKQIRDLLLSANFGSVDIHAGFSDGNQLKALFSEDYLTAAVNAGNHFHQLGVIKSPQINEFLLFNKFIKEKQNLVDYASHFVVLAGPNTAVVREVYDNAFVHFPDSNHKPEHQAIVSRKRSAPHVERQAMYPQLFKQSMPTAAALKPQAFNKGQLLVVDWINAVFRRDHRRFENLVQEYSDWLNSSDCSSSLDQGLFNISASNIVVSERGGVRHYQLIGSQRSLEEDHSTEITADFILFRTLYWFAKQNATLLQSYAVDNDIQSLGLFIIEHMDTVSDIDGLNEFARLENNIQAKLISTASPVTIEQQLLTPLYQSLSLIHI